MKKVDLNTIIQTYPSYEAYLDAEFNGKISEMKSRETTLNDEEKTLLTTISGYRTVIQQILASYTPSAEMTAAAQNGFWAIRCLYRYRKLVWFFYGKPAVYRENIGDQQKF